MTTVQDRAHPEKQVAENSKIEWTDHTFNPWWGCTKVSVGPQGACEHCYAESLAKRVGYPHLWDGMRRTFGEKHWREPLKWDERAQLEGRRFRVFCASMADVFDKDAPESERRRLWELIEATPYLDWLLLTKRVGNVLRMVPPHWHERFPRNVWLGISVVTPLEVARDVPKLQAIPAYIRFLSMEPLLEDIWMESHLDGIHWVIVGGESGRKARPMLAQWAENIRRDCELVGVPFFFKQGSAANWPAFKDASTFPASLRVREFPVAA